MEFTIAAVMTAWGFVALCTFFARDDDKCQEDKAGSMAAGILWPVYLPWVLGLMVWERRP